MKRFSCSLSFFTVTLFLLLSARKTWLLLFWLAAMLHELGHLFALRLLRGRVERFCFRLSGAEIRYAVGGLSYVSELLLALAGPAINLLCAAGCALVSQRWPVDWMYQFAGCHLILAFFNLIPALPLDGGRVLQVLLEYHFPLEGEQFAVRVSVCVGLGLMLLGLFILIKGGNPTLFFAGGVILVRSLPKNTLHLPEKLLK